MQEDVELKEYTPAIRIKAGELVCDADYYNKVPGASLWYTPTQGEERKTKVRMQQVVAANLKLTPISPSNKLPPGMSKKNKTATAATKLNAQRLDPAEHEKMLDDIHRREVLEHDEVEDDSSEDEESDEESDENEDEGEDE